MYYNYQTERIKYATVMNKKPQLKKTERATTAEQQVTKK